MSTIARVELRFLPALSRSVTVALTRSWRSFLITASPRLESLTRTRVVRLARIENRAEPSLTTRLRALASTGRAVSSENTPVHRRTPLHLSAMKTIPRADTATGRPEMSTNDRGRFLESGPGGGGAPDWDATGGTLTTIVRDALPVLPAVLATESVALCAPGDANEC